MIKRIEYNLRQEENLIEMVLNLFPEYKKVHVNGAFLYMNNGSVQLDTIPIFEFCMTHLCEKILNPNPNNPNRGLVDKFKDFFWKVNLFAMVSNEKVQHPINYLYEQFKQLKINK